MTGGMFSGARLEEFRRGWARFPFRGDAAHFWREQPERVPLIVEGGRVRHFRSQCGMEAESHPTLPAFGVGTMPVCRRCLKRNPPPNARDRLTFIEASKTR